MISKKTGKLRILSHSDEPFQDREEAGLLLAKELSELKSRNVVVLGVPKVPLALSLLSYFVFFLAFEIAVLQRQRPGAAEARQ